MRACQLRLLRQASRRVFTVAGTCLLCWTLIACDSGDDADTNVVYNFVDEFALGEPLVETSRLEFGKPAVRALMIDGWHHQDERWARKTPFVWGTGIRSTLDLPVFAARPLTLRFECRPFPRSGLRPDITVPDQGVTVVVNGWTIGAVKLEEGFRTYTLDIPANALVVGRNRVEFHYLYSPEGSSFLPSPSPDGVPRSVAWASVGFEPAWSIEAPSVGESADELRLPFNTGVDYFALAPAGAVLKLDGLDTWGDKPSAPRLEVHVSADDSSETVVTEHQPSMWRPPSAVPVHGETSPRLVRISFVARSGSDGGSPGGLTLQGPTLVAPTTHAPSLPDDVSVPDPVFPKPTNVLIYLIDTLRADHLGVYGYDLDTSPHLDAFAKDSVVFTDARAQSSWTRSSVASIFTGLHPRSHNVNGRADKLSPRALTLSTLLSASGYQTTGIITNGNVSKSFGFEIGFDRYEYLRELRTREIHVLSDAVNERATRWLDQRDPSRPFFLYLHTADPHDPYTPRSPFRERFVESPQFPDLVRLTALLERGVPAEDVQAVSHELRALYDAEIAFNDEQFGTLVQELKSRGLYDSTMIIVVSDHGEEFQDHGSWGHGKTLYEEQLAVPLIMKLPGQRHAGRTVDQPAQHVDLMPTILALLDLPIPPEVQGQSLWPAIATESTDRDTGSVAYLNLDGRAMESLQLGALKMIRFPPHETASQVEVFDLATDPAELANLAGERPVLRGYLLASLGRWVRRQPSLLSADEAVIDADLEERLRTLGYIR